MQHRKQKLALVDNAMAGMCALEDSLKVAPDFHDITVSGAEPHAHYICIGLAPVLAGEPASADIKGNPS